MASLINLNNKKTVRGCLSVPKCNTFDSLLETRMCNAAYCWSQKEHGKQVTHDHITLSRAGTLAVGQILPTLIFTGKTIKYFGSKSL